ncbi:MAG: LuxR C-terminal-related transcriptional regulator [Gammaproteobacteria bacterium]
MRCQPAAWCDRLLSLTEKEIEILTLLAEGLCNKKIAHRASIALTTVKWHLQNIFSKLEARNRTEAVLKAQEMHLVDGTGSGR